MELLSLLAEKDMRQVKDIRISFSAIIQKEKSGKTVKLFSKNTCYRS